MRAIKWNDSDGELKFVIYTEMKLSIVFSCDSPMPLNMQTGLMIVDVL